MTLRPRPAPARVVELARHALGAIAGDGGADIGERVAGDVLDIADFLDGALRIALGHLGRQFGLEHDDGQGVTKQVMQVAPDPLAFGDSREPRALVTRPLQREVLPAPPTVTMTIRMPPRGSPSPQIKVAAVAVIVREPDEGVANAFHPMEEGDRVVQKARCARIERGQRRTILRGRRFSRWRRLTGY